MRLFRISLVFATTILMSLPVMGQAFDEWNFGARTGLYVDESDFFIGVEATTPITNEVLFNPNIEWVMMDGGDLATINADVTYTFDADEMFWWGGLGIAGIYTNFNESDFDVGGNVIVGAGWILESWFVYAQAKAILADSNDGVIAVGVRF